ncbi:MAG: hypothetical protein NXI16_02990 [Alphaproteobacteria bacterium]|nr:hypothetical protein [Alphaproteobacteria bacterium]
MRGLDQPGGKLPLFDGVGRKVNRRIIEGCIENGWAEHWFFNPIKPDWIVCKLTPLGREMAEQAARQDTASESSSDTGSPSRSAPC